jgi:hypothetical protein
MNNKDTQLKKKFYKQFYISTKGKLPKNVEWYFMPSDVTYIEMWDFIHSVVEKQRKELEKEIKELLTGLLIEIGMMEDRATDSELKSGYYLSALGRIEKFILKQSLSHKKETKK